MFEAYIREEDKVGRSRFVADEPLLLRQDALKHAQNTPNLVPVAFDGAGNLLRVERDEPGRLAEVGALARGLEEEPLELGVVLVCTWGD